MAPLDRPCDVSPFCVPVRTQIAQLGLAPELPWRWVHLGPIGPRTLPCAEHRDTCRRDTRTLPADGPIGRFGGYHLDLLGLPSPAIGTGASYHATAALWFVYGVSWRNSADPRVEWRASPDGGGELRILPGADGFRPDAVAIAGRCADLLHGRLTRRGHPLAEPDVSWRNYELAVAADEMKARAPTLPYRAIAGILGVSERALRTYRASASRWHVSRGTRRMG